MTDVVAQAKDAAASAKADAVVVYSFWQKVGAFVASKPKFSVAVAVVAVVVASFVGHAV